MNSFRFDGVLPASKSILNRLLIVSSYEPALKILGHSDCDDVLDMQRALPLVLKANGNPIDCGAAGTTFRFLVLRASRIPGRHVLQGSAELMKRPQGALVEVLKQLGVRAHLSASAIELESDGWQEPSGPVQVDRSQSSQFASSLLLNAWNLPFELRIQSAGIAAGGDALSEGYFEMTKSLVREAGMKLEKSAGESLLVPAMSAVQPGRIRAEIDLSSAFAVAALAAVGGEAVLREFPDESLQPDAVFPKVLKRMGVSVEVDRGALKVKKATSLLPIEWNLRECPDLFPILAVLCSLAEGTSRLFGAPHLVHKESSRIEAVGNLLSVIDRDFKPLPDGMIVTGRTGALESRVWEFDPQNDHRLAMAAAVANLAGARLRVEHEQVVNKSFPGFWDIVRPSGVNPW